MIKVAQRIEDFEVGVTLVPVYDGFYRCLQDKANRWSVTLEECRILAAIAANRTVLEIGTGLGVSSTAMALTAKRVDTVDPCGWVADNIKTSLNVVRLMAISDAGYDYDLAFIDADHAKEAVLRDIADVTPRLAPGGFIVFHDRMLAEVLTALDTAEWLWRIDLNTRSGLTVCCHSGVVT